MDGLILEVISGRASPEVISTVMNWQRSPSCWDDIFSGLPALSARAADDPSRAALLFFLSHTLWRKLHLEWRFLPPSSLSSLPGRLLSLLSLPALPPPACSRLQAALALLLALSLSHPSSSSVTLSWSSLSAEFGGQLPSLLLALPGEAAALALPAARDAALSAALRSLARALLGATDAPLLAHPPLLRTWRRLADEIPPEFLRAAEAHVRAHVLDRAARRALAALAARDAALAAALLEAAPRARESPPASTPPPAWEDERLEDADLDGNPREGEDDDDGDGDDLEVGDDDDDDEEDDEAASVVRHGAAHLLTHPLVLGSPRLLLTALSSPLLPSSAASLAFSSSAVQAAAFRALSLSLSPAARHICHRLSTRRRLCCLSAWAAAEAALRCGAFAALPPPAIAALAAPLRAVGDEALRRRARALWLAVLRRLGIEEPDVGSWGGPTPTPTPTAPAPSGGSDRGIGDAAATALEDPRLGALWLAGALAPFGRAAERVACAKALLPSGVLARARALWTPPVARAIAAVFVRSVGGTSMGVSGGASMGASIGPSIGPSMGPSMGIGWAPRGGWRALAALLAAADAPPPCAAVACTIDLCRLASALLPRLPPSRAAAWARWLASAPPRRVAEVLRAHGFSVPPDDYRAREGRIDDHRARRGEGEEEEEEETAWAEAMGLALRHAAGAVPSAWAWAAGAAARGGDALRAAGGGWREAPPAEVAVWAQAAAAHAPVELVAPALAALREWARLRGPEGSLRPSSSSSPSFSLSPSPLSSDEAAAEALLAECARLALRRREWRAVAAALPWVGERGGAVDVVETVLGALSRREAAETWTAAAEAVAAVAVRERWGEAEGREAFARAAGVELLWVTAEEWAEMGRLVGCRVASGKSVFALLLDIAHIATGQMHIEYLNEYVF